MTGSIFPLPVGNLVLLRRSKRALESKGLHLEFAPAGNIKLIPDEGVVRQGRSKSRRRYAICASTPVVIDIRQWAVIKEGATDRRGRYSK